MFLIPSAHRFGRPTAQSGLGLVELMIGVTVGLIVAAGASLVATQQINEHRRLMLEVQMQQDLRVAADLLQQDLRRAGFRGLPANGVWEPERSAGAAAAKDPASSPYSEVASVQSGNDVSLYYRYARKTSGSFNQTNLVVDNERFGIRWNASTKVLYLQLGVVNGVPNWQPITDPDAVLIVDFVPSIQTQTIDLADLCDSSCTSAGTCPTQSVRVVNFTIKAQAKADSNVKRTLNVTEKLRADDISGVCPA